MNSPTSLLNVLEEAFAADNLANALPGIARAVELGQLSLDSPDRPLLEALIFEYGVITADRLAAFRPLLDAVSRCGHGPWGCSSWGHDTIYRFLTGDLVCDELLEWCWEQPGGPEILEPTIARQVRSDRLGAVLHDYPFGHVSHERQMHQHGFALDERWANGQTTLARITEHLLVHLPAHQKPFEWTATLRQCRRLAKSAAQFLSQDERFLAVIPACLAAERAWRSHLDVLRYHPGEDLPEWTAPWLETLKDVAPALKSKRGTALEGWSAFTGWAAKAPPSVELVGALVGGWRVLAALFPDHFSTKASRLALVDAVTQGLERIGVNTLLSSEALNVHYPLDHPFWQDFEGSQRGKDSTERWSPDEVWKVVLPLAIKNRPDNSLNSSFARRMARWLPPGETFQWPATPFWNQVVALWGWDHAVRSQARTKFLEQACEAEGASGTLPTRRVRF